MKYTKLFFLPLLIVLAGCPPNNEPTNNSPSTTQNHPVQGHQHSHDHSAEGPHGGHLLELGDEDYHLEWLHDEAGKLTFFLLDDHALTDVTTSANIITIETTIKDEITSVDIPTVSANDETHHQFQTINPVLLQHLQLVGHGVTAHVTVMIGDEKFTGMFEHQEGDGHAH